MTEKQKGIIKKRDFFFLCRVETRREMKQRKEKLEVEDHFL